MDDAPPPKNRKGRELDDPIAHIADIVRDHLAKAQSSDSIQSINKVVGSDGARNPICEWCGLIHPKRQCQRIRSLEFYANGMLKRIEFHDLAILMRTPDFVQWPLLQWPQWPLSMPMSSTVPLAILFP